MPATIERIQRICVETDPLDLVVPFTTPELTRIALRKAAELARGVHSRIRILRLQRVPYPLQLQQPPVAADVLREQTEQIARGLEAAEIQIVLTRDSDLTLLENLRPESIVVIASRRRPWRTRQERLRNFCESHGSRVALLYAA